MVAVPFKSLLAFIFMVFLEWRSNSICIHSKECPIDLRCTAIDLPVKRNFRRLLVLIIIIINLLKCKDLNPRHNALRHRVHHPYVTIEMTIEEVV